MITILYILIPIAIVATVLLLKSKKKESEPPVSAPKPVFPTGPVHDERVKFPCEEAWSWMYNYAPGGQVFDVGETGSMVPYFNGSEFIVTAKNYAGLKIGDIVAYTTVGGSAPAVGSRIVHRIAARNEQGAWLPRGDTPGMPLEDWNPITESNYIGTLVAVFRPLA